MIEILTGLGLAMSAGLNAYVPVLALGLLHRYTAVVELPTQWAWLGNGWVLGAVAVLLVVEVVTDKVPAVDHLNDLVQTLVRPVSGGVVFTSGATAATTGNADPAGPFTDGALLPFLLGLVVALGLHMVKAALRPVINLTTGGIGAPLISTAEDASAVVIVIVAILLPVLVILATAGVAAVVVWLVRRRRTRAPAAPAP